MRYEIDIFGVLVPSLLVWLLVTYALCAILRRVFQLSPPAKARFSRRLMKEFSYAYRADCASL